MRLKWRVYRAFFATNVERIELLNSISGLTAQVIQDTLYDDVVLHLCRAADPAFQRGKANNTFRRLIELTGDCAGKPELERLCVQFLHTCSPLRQRRNTSIAHSDRQAHFASDGIGGVSRKQIEDALEAWRNLTRYIGLAAFDSDLATTLVPQHNDDEVTFLRALYHGREAIGVRTAEAMRMAAQPADPRREPPEIGMLRDIFEQPAWLNCRPSDKHD